MVNAKVLAIAGGCLALVLMGCPRSKLPTHVDQQATEFPGPPPWSVPSDQAARLGAAGLPRVPSGSHAGVIYHIHAGLRVYYMGQAVPVPAGLGLDKYGVPVSPVHTHQASGIVHVEYAEPREFSLGQLFLLWGVPLGKAKVLVDGVPWPDPAGLVLQDHQQIVVLFGPPPADPIPWPQGTPSESEGLPTPESSEIPEPTASGDPDEASPTPDP